MAHILVIDDEKIIREMLRDILEPLGHEIEEAENGQKGLDRYDPENVDLVITDIMMPEKDGFMTIAEIKKINPNQKIIAFTGYGLHNLPIALDLGATRVYEKPIKPNDFRKAVSDLLAE
ncbi:MAG: response regulator [bacterium]|nr:response regulator [bacterium]